MGEIAEMAGVGSPAVSNWKRRHPDFPVEVEVDLYDSAAIEEWLRGHGKSVKIVRPSTDELLWDWASDLRGTMSLEEAPEFLLQLLTLRTAHNTQVEQLVPVSRYWKRVSSQETQPGMTLAQVSEDLKESHPDLARALSPGGSADAVRDPTAKRLIRLFDDLELKAHGAGRLATRLLERFADGGGPRVAQFATEAEVTDLMTRLLEPIKGSVYDPACGAGMALAAAWRRGGPAITRLYGQEINERSWRLAYLHLLLYDAPFEVDTGDTLVDDRFWGSSMNRVLLDAPFNAIRRGGIAEKDQRWAGGPTPPGNSDLAWVEHAISHLADDGVGVVTVPLRSLFREGVESDIRVKIIQSDVLDAVIQLPPGVNPHTGIPLAMFLLDRRRRKREGRILFIDARQLGRPQRGRTHVFDEGGIDRITAVVEDWRTGRFRPEPQFSGSATADEIRRSKGSLSVSRYIEYAQIVTEIDGEPIPERLERLGQAIPDSLLSAPEIIIMLEHFSEERPTVASSPAVVRLGDLLLADPRVGVRQETEGAKTTQSRRLSKVDGAPTPFVTTSSVSQGLGVLSQDPTEITFNPRGLTAPGDLLLVSRGAERLASARCATVRFETPAAYSESLICLRLNPEVVDPDYLRMYLTSRQGSLALAAAATGSVISNLRPDALRDLGIRLPDMATQRAMASEMREVDSYVDLIEESATRVRDYQDTLREGLVSGILPAVPEEKS